MNTRKLHFFSGLVIAAFVVLHLFNHLYSLAGAEAHIAMMDKLRLIYRNVFAEILLISAILVQIITGIKQYRQMRKIATSFFDKLQLYSGLYLAFFFMLHVSAVMTGRYYLQLDTNYYFGGTGLNVFPFNLFFIPYYVLAIMAFFGHLAAVHHKKMRHSVAGITPYMQSLLMLAFGAVLCIILMYGLTNGFSGISIPEEYKVLIGK